MSTEPISHIYVGRMPCGCYAAWRCDQDDADTHRAVAAMHDDGMTVERLPADESTAKRPVYRRDQHRRGLCPQSQPSLLSEATR